MGFGPQYDTWEPFSSFSSTSLIDAKFGFHASAVVSESLQATEIVAPCANIRKEQAIAKNRASTAVSTANWPCGIYVSIDEVILCKKRPCISLNRITGLFCWQVYKAESCTQMLLFLVAIMSLLPLDQVKMLVYDDMCHLAPFIAKHRSKGPVYEALANTLKAIDGFHFPNHVSPTCILLYNPKNFACLDKVRILRS